MQRATTYETGPPLVGCAASGCGAAGTALAMNECSPDMRLSVCLRAVVVEGGGRDCDLVELLVAHLYGTLHGRHHH